MQLRHWQRLALALMAAWLMLMLLTPQLAHADSLWPVDVRDTGLNSQVVGLPNGAVVGCDFGTPPIDAKVLSSSGQVLMAVPRSSAGVLNNTCNYYVGAPMTVAEDGTLFARRFTEGTTAFRDVVALRLGAEVWPRPLDVKSYCGGNGQPKASTYTTRYGLYLLVSRENAACLSTGRNVLLRINKTTGAALQTSHVPGSANFFGVMTPTKNGIVLAKEDATSYVSYSGNVTTVPQALEPGLMPDQPVISYEGTRFVAHYSFAAGGGCNSPTGQLFRKVSAYSPTGKLWDFALPNCVSYARLVPTPDGGVTVNYQVSDPLNRYSELLALNAAGRPMWSSPYRLPRDVRFPDGLLSVKADNNGLLVITWTDTRMSP